MRGLVAGVALRREDLAARLAGAIVPLVALGVAGVMGLVPLLDLTAIRLAGVIVMAVITLRPTGGFTAMAMVITPLATAAAMSRRQASPAWR